ncbi:MAG: hypothetical protein KGV59_05500 [Tenacibaculum sp.]|nr:hypothetical protein [Tenacibaculum sp.]
MKFIEVTITEDNKTQTSLVNVDEILIVTLFKNETFILMKGGNENQKINESYEEIKNKLIGNE